jgi:hypothetical protein
MASATSARYRERIFMIIRKIGRGDKNNISPPLIVIY